MKNDLLKLIESELDRLPDDGLDLSDIGNSFALAVCSFLSTDRHGFSVEDFMHGIEHGLSIGNRSST